MDCSSCAESVEKALRQLEGVQDVRVDIVGGRVSVEYAEGKLARGVAKPSRSPAWTAPTRCGCWKASSATCRA